MTEADRADLLRNGIGHNAVEEGARTRTFNLVFGER